MMLKMCETSSVWVGGHPQYDYKIRVKTLMGNEFGEVGIFFSENQLPPVFQKTDEKKLPNTAPPTRDFQSQNDGGMGSLFSTEE